MADAMVERRPNTRFFCHRCLVEFEDVLQDYICPYCEGGFIEQLESEVENVTMSGDDHSDADMSNLDDLSNIDEVSNMDDSDDAHRATPPMLNDLAFLMSGGRIRGTGPIRQTDTATPNGTTTNTTANTNSGNSTGNGGNTNTNSNTGRRPNLLEEIVWMIGGGRPPAGAVTAGSPFVLVGTPGDYVFGGEGLDAVVTQLLGQLEHSGPPPLPRERLAELPSEPVTEEQARAEAACSVCWENFQIGEMVSRLECEHVFHQSCITPWLQLHATCPICRRSLIPDTPDPPPAATNTTAATTTTTTTTTTNNTNNTNTNTNTNTNPSTITETQIRIAARPHVVIRRSTGAHPAFFRRFPTQMHTWDSLNDTSSGSMSPASSITTGGIWAPQTRTSNSTTSTNSSTSLNSNERERQYNTDIDYD